MKRLLLAALLVGIVGFAAMAISVTSHWVGCTSYVISVSGIPEVQQPEFTSSLFDFLNTTKNWDAGKDEVSIHHIIIGGNMYTLEDVGIGVSSFVPYESITISIPATWNGTPLLSTGDVVKVYAQWYDGETPIDTITVGPCGGGGPETPARVPAPDIRVTLTMDENGMTATLTNTGNLTATVPLAGMVFALTPMPDWIPDSAPDIYWHPDPVLEGTVTIAPHATETVTFPTPTMSMTALAAYYELVSFWYPQFVGEQTYLAVGFPFGAGTAWGWYPPAKP